MEYVDEHGEAVLRFPAFLTLPQHVVRLILSRDELQADELCKFQAALKWSRRYVRKTPGSTLKSAMKPFVDTIAFHLIPTQSLMQDVRETNVVPDDKILTALAFQADPSSIDPSTLSTTPLRLRLSMLSLSLQDHSGLYDDLDEASTESRSISGESQSSNISTPKPMNHVTFKDASRDEDDSTPTNSGLAESDSESEDDDDVDNNSSPISTIDIRLNDNDISTENILDNINRSPRNSPRISPSSSSQDLTSLNLSILESDSLLRRKSIDEISHTTQSTNFESVSSIAMSTSSSSSEGSVGGSFGKADRTVPVLKTHLELPGMPF